VSINFRPSPRDDFESQIHRGKKSALRKDRHIEHGKPIREGRSTESEGTHEAADENGGAASMTETEQPLEARDQLDVISARKDLSIDLFHLQLIKVLHDDGDRVRDPIKECWKGLKVQK